MRKQKMPHRPASQPTPRGISPMAAINLRAQSTQAYSYPIQAPTLPRGVVPKGASLAMDASLYDYMTPLAAGQSYTGFAGYPHLSGLAARSEYRAFASALSSEMVRKWIKLVSSETDDDETKEKIHAIEKEFERLHVKELFARLVSDDALFGRAQLFIDAGSSEKNEPLIISPVTIKKGGLRGLACIEPMWTTPSAYNSTNPAASDFFKPSAWYMLGEEVHASRLLTVITRPMPDILKPAFNFSGISLSQLAEPYVNNWLRTRQSVSDLINNFSITVLATSMDAILQGDDDGQGLNSRLDVFAATRTNRGVLALDKEREELVQVNTPLGGLHELQAQSQEQMCAVSRMPSVILTGISPNGMNASSEGELTTWYDWIAAQQVAHLEEPLRKVLHIVMLSLFGEIDDDIHLEWQPLQQMDAVQESTIRKTDCDTAMAYINGGVISPEEERERLARDKKSLYQGLDLNVELQQPQEEGNPENDPPEDDPEKMAHDADKWITVHPNGKDGHGTPALIGEGGVIKGGMGGKFNGLNIKDANKEKLQERTEKRTRGAVEHGKQAAKGVAAPKLGKQTDLAQSIKELGGVHISHAKDTLGDNPQGAWKFAFGKEGKGMDDLATQLKDKGFDIDTDAHDGGVQQLKDMIRAHHDGERVGLHHETENAAEHEAYSQNRDALAEKAAQRGIVVSKGMTDAAISHAIDHYDAREEAESLGLKVTAKMKPSEIYDMVNAEIEHRQGLERTEREDRLNSQRQRDMDNERENTARLANSDNFQFGENSEEAHNPTGGIFTQPSHEIGAEIESQHKDVQPAAQVEQTKPREETMAEFWDRSHKSRKNPEVQAKFRAEMDRIKEGKANGTISSYVPHPKITEAEHRLAEKNDILDNAIARGDKSFKVESMREAVKDAERNLKESHEALISGVGQVKAQNEEQMEVSRKFLGVAKNYGKEEPKNANKQSYIEKMRAKGMSNAENEA